MKDMETTINKELVAAAAGRAIFCPKCGGVLDAPNAVLVEPVNHKGIAVFCKPCWVKAQPQILVAVTTTSGASGLTHTFHPVSHAEPVKSEAEITGTQEELF